MKEPAIISHSSIEVTAYVPIKRAVDDPAKNFAKIRTLAKTDDGKTVRVNIQKPKPLIKRKVRLSDVWATERS